MRQEENQIICTTYQIPFFPYFVTLNHTKGTTLDLNMPKSTCHTYFIFWRMIIQMTSFDFVKKYEIRIFHFIDTSTIQESMFLCEKDTLDQTVIQCILYSKRKKPKHTLFLDLQKFLWGYQGSPPRRDEICHPNEPHRFYVLSIRQNIYCLQSSQLLCHQVRIIQTTKQAAKRCFFLKQKYKINIALFFKLSHTKKEYILYGRCLGFFCKPLSAPCSSKTNLVLRFLSLFQQRGELWRDSEDKSLGTRLQQNCNRDLKGYMK